MSSYPKFHVNPDPTYPKTPTPPGPPKPRNAVELHRSGTVEKVFMEWFSEVGALLGYHSMSRTVETGGVTFVIRWNQSGTDYSLSHVITNVDIAHLDVSVLKVKLATVTETIKRTLEES